MMIALVLIPLAMIALVSGDDSSCADPTGADYTGDDRPSACEHIPKNSTSSKEIVQIYLPYLLLFASLPFNRILPC